MFEKITFLNLGNSLPALRRRVAASPAARGIFYLLLCAAVGYAGLRDPYMMLVVLGGVLLLVLAGRKPRAAAALLIFAIPFTNISELNIQFLPLPGAKPLQLIGAFAAFVALINPGQWRRMPRLAALFAAVLIALFSVAMLRSLSRLEVINHFYYFEDPLSPPRYLLSEYVKPLIYFFPFFLVLKLFRNFRQITGLITLLCAAISLLGLLIIYVYIFQCPDHTDIVAVRDQLAVSTGLHSNDLANFYIIGFPLLLVNYFYGRKLPGLVMLGICAVSVALIFSRTAYVLVIASSIGFLMVTKRSTWLPVVTAGLLVVALLIGPTIAERVSKGLESGESNEILAGRTEEIWYPLIAEYLGEPAGLLFGKGRYSITSTEAAKWGIILQVTHPHNMYLEMVLDAGLLGLTVMLGFLGTLVAAVYRSLKNIEPRIIRDYQWALLIALVAYLVAGFSGRSLFPVQANSYFWITLALACLIAEGWGARQGEPAVTKT